MMSSEQVSMRCCRWSLLLSALAAVGMAGCEGGGGGSGIVSPPGYFDDIAFADALDPADTAPGAIEPETLDPDGGGPGPGSDAIAPGDGSGEPVYCLVGEPCDDLDPCTTHDFCDDGLCVGTPYECEDDGLACTLDLCDGAGGCVHPIRGDSCLIEGECFADNDPHPSIVCLGCVSPVSQSDWSPDDRLPCDDDNPCTVGERCEDAQCGGGWPNPCHDGNPCTEGTCQPSTGCTQSPKSGPCSDGNPCTLGDVCEQGSCVSGTEILICNDNNACTDDSCAPGEGCRFVPNSKPCDDGDACTLGDGCGDGVCLPGASALACEDNNPCTDNVCNPQLGCTFPPNAEPCSDNNACTVGDTCMGGSCFPGLSALPCDDGNVCTDFGCEPAVGCVYSNNTLPCDDGNACTLGDVCNAGACTTGPTPLACDDGNVCTNDGCSPSLGCVYAFNTAPCNDGDACTVGDVCSEGVCAGTAKVCDDGNACTVDSCQAGTGQCVFEPITTTFQCIPQINITQPARAAQLTGSTTVVVSGTVQSGGGPIVSFNLNGTSVAVGAGGAFTTTVTAKTGMNLLDFEAVDAIGNQQGRVQSFYWSSLWTPLNIAAPLVSGLIDGLMLWLGKAAIDDGDHNPAKINDLATVMELVAASFNLQQFISNPIGNVSGVRIDLTSLTHAPPKVSLTPINGGLNLKMSIANVVANLKFTYQVCIIGCFDVTATGKATASQVLIDTNLFISVNSATGKVSVTAANTKATVSGLNVTLDGAIGFLTNWIINFFESTFASQLEQAFVSQLGAVLPGLLAQALESIAIEQSFNIPGLVQGAPSVTVKLESILSSAVFTPDGGTLGLRAAVSTPKNQPLPTLGLLRRAGCGSGSEPKPQLATAFPLQIALQDDVLNSILYALWWGGGLRFPVDAQLLAGVALPPGISGVNLQVEFLLPPVVNNCNPSAAPKLQVGDIRIDASLMLGPIPVQFQIFASLQAAVSFASVDGPAGKELGLNVGAIEIARTDLVYSNEALLSLDAALSGIIEQQLVPQLISGLAGGALAGFPIPEIDLSFIGGVPPGTKLAINLQGVVRSVGYTVMRGTVK